MYPLTDRVAAVLKDSSLEVFREVKAELPADCHVEHILSHIGDLIAVAERVTAKEASIGKASRSVADLTGAYEAIIGHITDTVRYGYRAAGALPEAVGKQGQSIVEVRDHLSFVRALFENRANLESRSEIAFFTTNYDTLLEDALCLSRRVPIDGFTGSAIGFWNPEAAERSEAALQTNASFVYKLHGSVDWILDKEYGLVRCRYDTNYLATTQNVLIYPQATKYVETQKDPFAYLFAAFRRALASQASHVLAVCGYSFGDNHINNEIAYALQSRSRKTNLLAFVKEIEPPAGTAGPSELPEVLKAWVADDDLNARVYVATNKALYWKGLKLEKPAAAGMSWWTFTGLTDFLRNGSF